MCLDVILFPTNSKEKRFMRFKDCKTEDFILAVKNSNSIRQVLIALGYKRPSGNYAIIRKHIKKMNLDISHFKGQGWSKGLSYKSPRIRPIDIYLTNKFYISSSRLKERLIDEEFFKIECMKCKNTEWMNLPIPTELHHIDSNHKNNNLSNLQILCPNCHAQTTNYCSKRKKLITFNGKTQPLSVWAEEYKINCLTLHSRLYLHKWPIEKALTTPVGYRDHL